MLRAPRSAAASSVAVLRRPHQKKPQGRLSTCKSNCGDDCFPWQFKFSHGGSGRAQSWRRLIWQAYPTAFLRPVTCWAPCWVRREQQRWCLADSMASGASLKLDVSFAWGLTGLAGGAACVTHDATWVPEAGRGLHLLPVSPASLAGAWLPVGAQTP